LVVGSVRNLSVVSMYELLFLIHSHCTLPMAHVYSLLFESYLLVHLPLTSMYNLFMGRYLPLHLLVTDMYYPVYTWLDPPIRWVDNSKMDLRDGMGWIESIWLRIWASGWLLWTP
jgi:ATP/ADP translocase